MNRAAEATSNKVAEVTFLFWVIKIFATTLGETAVFAAGLALIAAAYFLSKMSRDLLFWAAFILTRPLGATLGDLLTKSPDEGGLNFSRIDSSAIIALAMIALIAGPGLSRRLRRKESGESA